MISLLTDKLILQIIKHNSLRYTYIQGRALGLGAVSRWGLEADLEFYPYISAGEWYLLLYKGGVATCYFIE